MTVYASLNAGEPRYVNREGVEIKPNSSHKSQVCLNQNICPVISLDIPPLKKEDRDLLIQRTLPTHFPDSLEEWEWNSRHLGQATYVFLIKREIIERIRRDWGKDAILLSPALSLPLGEGKEVYQFSAGSGYDLFFCNGSRLDHGIHLAEESDMPILVKEFLGESARPRLFELETNLPSLFARKENKKGRLKLLLALLPLIPLASFFFQWQESRELLNQYEEWKNVRSELLSQRIGQDGNIPWKEIRKILEENSPSDLYGRLEILYPYFSGKATILNLSFQGQDFQIQARGKDPLNILEKLRTVPEIERITLYQSREQESLELFNLSGRWK